MSLHELYDLPRPDWWDHAACRGYGHLRDADGNPLPNPFFPDKGRPGVNAARQAHALCAICPVQEQCAEAGKDEMYGIWAGTGRKARVKERVALRKDPAPCNTYAGYGRHLRDGEKPCEQCDGARRRYQADRRVGANAERIRARRASYMKARRARKKAEREAAA